MVTCRRGNQMQSRQTDLSSGVVRFTFIVALGAAVLIAVSPPLLHLFYNIKFVRGGMTMEAQINAHDVSELATRNPGMWTFEALRLNELVGDKDPTSSQAIFESNGTLVTQIGSSDLQRPVLHHVHPILDSGLQVGEVVVSKSINNYLRQSLLLFVFSSIAGGLAFWGLKSMPLRLLKRAVDRAAYLASHDPLTRLPNRTLFGEWMLHYLTKGRDAQSTLAVLCLDLDHFKEVNDILGHSAGDDLLLQATNRMTDCIQRNDVVARLGGDEFAFIQMDGPQPESSTLLADRLIAALSQPFDLNGSEVTVGASIGITLHDESDGAQSGEELLRQADLALYRAKSEGRGTFRYFEDEMNEKLIARKRLENDLRNAIARDELQLHFQPQIDLETNEISGVEALLRWDRGGNGLVAPDDFIPLAEETGLIIPIGEWVIRRACACARDWPDLTVAVNVSPVQFRQGNLAQTVRDALAQEGVDPRRLEVEITEGVLLKHTEDTMQTLAELQSMGVKIAMDDFGTGYSSLNYLRSFPFDKIKIDRSFVSDLGKDGDADSIIDAVISLGQSIGMKANAEGVETVEQAQLLRDKGCDEAQGFLFSRPLPSSSIGELLADWEWTKAQFEIDPDNSPQSRQA